MLAMSIRYLMGWAMATDPADRTHPEWPPHPDRVFMAMAAAYFEGSGAGDEREALEWLERQAPPDIRASEYAVRSPTAAFVPVNDSEMPRIRAGKPLSPATVERALQLLPEQRPRQRRHFPVAVPHDPTVHLIWNQDPPAAVRGSLEALCRRVIRVGHSASLVQAGIDDAPGAPSLVPAGIGRTHLRVPGPGRLAHLERQYQQGRRPERSRWVAYDIPQPQAKSPLAESVFDSRMVVLRRVDGRELGLESTLALTARIHDTLMAHCPQPVPEWLSGHAADGRPSRAPHLASLPLAHVGGPYADGHLLGVALAVPRHVSFADLASCLGPAIGPGPDGSARRIRVYAGRLFEWEMEIEQRESPPAALRAETWARPSARWATVTPIVFDRHPRGRDQDRQVEEMVARACERIGLPQPYEVAISQVAPHTGVPHSRDFPLLRRKAASGSQRHTHAVITFTEPVRGPVLLGAGRHRGYGLCKPVEQSEDVRS